MTDTLHRHDEGGPVATITCDLPTATASWVLPAGQVADDHPELGTGGYVYFTLHETPTTPLAGADLLDFSGALLEADTAVSAVAPVDPGTEYRAHLLIAYEGGEAWHNDTVFTCTASTDIELEVLPFTGPVDWLLPLVLLVAGIGMVRLGGRL